MNPRARGRGRGCRVEGLLVAIVVATGGAGVGAQERRQAPPVFGATVARVRVDVIVNDDAGAFVADLDAGDFRLFEDEVEQQILDLQLVDLAAGEVQRLATENAAASPAGSAAVGPGPPGRGVGGDLAARRGGGGGDRGARSGDLAAGARDLEPAPGRRTVGGETADSARGLGAIVFLIDGPSLTLNTRARFADAWSRIVADTDEVAAPRAVYVVDTAGRLEEVTPLTDDPGALERAVEVIQGTPVNRTPFVTRLVEIARDLQDEDMRELAAAKARLYEGEERGRSLAAYDLLTRFCEALAARPGRTAVVWVSAGIKLMSGGPYTALLGAAAGDLDAPSYDLFSPDATIRRRQQQLHRAANSANVSIYSVDPTPLAESRLIGSSGEIQTAATAQMFQTPTFQGSVDGMRDALRNASASTGGRAFIHATDLPAVLREIEEDSSRFYLLTYAAPAPEGDGEYHEIRVEVSRPDVRVRSRAGYVDYPAAERVERVLAAAMALPGSVDDLPVAAEVFSSWGGRDRATAMLAVAVDAPAVGIAVDDDGARTASLDVHAAVYDGDELVDDVHEALNARRRARPDEDADAEFAPLGYLVYRHEWQLSPGEYDLRVAVVDNVSGRLGAARLDLDIEEPASGWSASDPILVAAEPSGAVQPVVLGRALVGQLLSAFVEVRGGMQPILSGQVFGDDATAGAERGTMETGAERGAAGRSPQPGAADRNPQRAAADRVAPRAIAEAAGAGRQETQSARLFPNPLRRVAADLHRGAVVLPMLPPGRYLLQLVVTDPPAGQHEIRRLPFEVIDPIPR